METTQNTYNNVPVVFTIGHSVKRAEEIAEALALAGVETLIDCRSKPYSRFNPQFNKTSFPGPLSGYAITYEWRGNNLGGLQQNILHDESLDELADRAHNGEKLALCCSESDFKKCHRGTELAPELLKRGVAIHHIMPNKKDVILQPSEFSV
jgi:uncharacterized protein (DUF488 family)